MTEAAEQEALIERAQYHPITRELIYAIPNDGKRSVITGAKFKRRGLRPGMPDICLPYPSNGFHALYIELKTKTGKPTKEQLECIANLNRVGNYAIIAYGWEHAWNIITDYLKAKNMKIKIEHSMQFTSVNYAEDSHTWNITMHGNEWPWMMKASKIYCPDCKSYEVHIHSNYIKGGKRYQCLNPNCKTVTFIVK